MTTLTHWKKLRNHKYLGSHDLYNEQGEKVTIDTRVTRVTTEMVANQEGGKDSCIVAYLENTKPMILNATNCKRLEGFANSPLIENWAGITVTVKIERVRAFGAWHEALRFDKTQPKIAAATAPEKPNLNPESPNWADAVNYYATAPDKDKAKAAMYGKYTITPGDWATLTGKGGENV